MATIRKRNLKWQVQVRHQGHNLSRTFIRRADAVLWGKQTELELDRAGLPSDRRALAGLKVSDLLIRFREIVEPHRPGCALETIVINAMLRHSVADVPLSYLSSKHFAAYRDERLATVKAATVNRQLNLLHRIFQIAKTDWGIPLSENPIKGIRAPKADKARERRITDEEKKRLLEGLESSRNHLLSAIVQFAMASAMRRGELINARWEHLNWDAGTLHIPLAKTGYPRTIPLSFEAKRVLVELAIIWDGYDNIFPISAEAVRLGWQRLTTRAGVEDLHFHDLRHEAISRFFERGLTIPEVALISGHRDPRMLFRYTHLRAEDVARKLGAS